MLLHEPNNKTHHTRKCGTIDIDNLVTKPFIASAAGSASKHHPLGFKRRDQLGHCGHVGTFASDCTALAEKVSGLTFGRTRKGCSPSGPQAPHQAGQNQSCCRSHLAYETSECHALEYAQHGQGTTFVGGQHPSYLANAQPQTPFNRDFQTRPRQKLCREADRCRGPVSEPAGKGADSVRGRKEPNTGIGMHATAFTSQIRNTGTANSRLQAQRHNDVVCRPERTRRQGHWRLYAALPASGVYSVPQEDRYANTSRSGSSSDRGQLCHAQAPASQGLVQAPSTVSSAFYADLQFVAQHGRTLVSRNHRQAYPARVFLQRSGIDCSHQRIFEKSQPKSSSVRLERTGG